MKVSVKDVPEKILLEHGHRRHNARLTTRVESVEFHIGRY